MSFRWRPGSSAGKDDARAISQREVDYGEEPPTSVPHARGRSVHRNSCETTCFVFLFRWCLAGMVSAALCLRMFGWGFTHSESHLDRYPPGEHGHAYAYSGRDSGGAGTRHVKTRWRPKAASPGVSGDGGISTREGENERIPRPGPGPATVLIRPNGEDQHHGPNTSNLSDFFEEVDMLAVTSAVARYALFARSALAEDQLAVEQGKPLQGKYIVLEAGNELANRIRGVLSGFFLGILTNRVFVTDITYQKDVRQGLLSALFEGPGYQWDLSQLPTSLTAKFAPSAASKIVFDMREEDFFSWVCQDVLASTRLSGAPVIVLSTVVYPLPLLARNTVYAAHPLLAAGRLPNTPSDLRDNPNAMLRGGPGAESSLHWQGFAGGGQGRIEVLETLLTRAILQPTEELRVRAREMVETVRKKAAAWGEKRGMSAPPRVVGLHIRTYFVKAVSAGTLEENLMEFAKCASVESTGADDDPFFFVATDEAQTQAIARQVWGDRCFFADFGLPGSRLEGIKSAFIDLLVMGSLDDFVITPHSSFSELGSTLSYTWLPDRAEALLTLPNRPMVPLFPGMNGFESRKVMSLLDRRAAPVGETGAKNGQCLRLYAAGMSLAVAKGRHIKSMFEVIEQAECLRESPGIADV